MLAAALAAGGNAVVAFVNGASQRDLEKSKQEAERILEMIKTGGGENAAKRADVNLRFLLESGLIADPVLGAKLSAYLDKTPKGSGPLLPSASTRLGFDDAAPIDASLRRNLETIFTRYLAYLDKAGFPPAIKKIVVQIEPGFDNAAYDGEKIIIDDKIADDPSVPIREYMHHVLLEGGRTSAHAARSHRRRSRGLFRLQFLEHAGAR
ncbi:hypothetical protein [Tahibacter soli]|uniref:Uncharacterized protein n=1 Tax=Tahibacter soli TaxID=2983605 RepID=A0A9X3YQS2_9GAMM|nr:hypothetical protein [Tahibacter soli]MDC8016247.1 hypothetical protein [Tahibacter soli]